MTPKKSFEVGSWVVYPSHGVGKLNDIERFNVAGEVIEFFVISFSKNKLTLKIPVKKAINSGLRGVSGKGQMENAFDILIQKTRKSKLAWNKRAQEYETKINSGDPCSIAEVIRELHKTDSKSVQSFSERQLYQRAIERLANELSIMEGINEEDAVRKLEIILQAA